MTTKKSTLLPRRRRGLPPRSAAAIAAQSLGTVSGLAADHLADGRPIDVMTDDWSALDAEHLPRFIHNLRELVLQERERHLNTRLELAHARRGLAETEIDLLHTKLRDADFKLWQHRTGGST